MSELRLAFGLRDLPDVPTAWGARLIYPNDLLHDRQDLVGPRSDELVSWLNDGPLRLAREALAARPVGPTEDRQVTLYEDGTGIIVGNPQASHGYVYVAAWFKRDVVRGVTVHTFDSTSEAYDASQTDEAIRAGDLLAVPSERVVGVLVAAWPVALGSECGSFHRALESFDWSDVDGKDLSESRRAGLALLELWG